MNSLAIDWGAPKLKLGRLSYWTSYADSAETTISSANGWKIDTVKNGKRTVISCSHERLGFAFRLDVENLENGLKITLPKESLKEGKNHLGSLLFLPDFTMRHEGDSGYYIIPQQSGVISGFSGKQEGTYHIGVYGNGMSECNMPIFGVADDSGVLCAILGPGNCDAVLELETAHGAEKAYRIAFRYIFRYECHVRRQNWPVVCEDFTLTLQSVWNDGRNPAALLAETYRNLRIAKEEIVPLSERVKQSPELANAVKSPEVRIRLAVKWPFPCKMAEQTPENEPGVHVFCSFDDVKHFIDKFKAAGIGHLNICLVGWAAKGHDGRYPQILPVEETLGGETKLRELIRYAQEAGYFISAHDNHYDAYHISEDPIEGILIRNQEDACLMDGVWGGGQAYLSCPEAMYKTYSKRNLETIRDLGFRGTHFTDCLSTTGLKVCWSKEHPQTKSGMAHWRREILRLAKQTMGSIECEGPFDFATGVLDRVLYINTDSGRPDEELRTRDYVDEIVPLYEMVHHGIILYNTTKEAINSLPDSRAYLRNLAFGGMPSFYFYRHFATKNYDPKTGLPVEGRFETSDFIKENIDREAVAIRKAEKDYIGMAGMEQFCFIQDFKVYSETLTRTDFSNGRKLYVNWSDTEAKVEGVNIPPCSFKLDQE